MEEVKIVPKQVTETVHDFYCDYCNKHLGQTVECHDGYYPKLGRMETSFNTNNNRFTFDKNLCDECKEKFWAKLKESLIQLGFEVS